jgi:hypothetical protein
MPRLSKPEVVITLGILAYLVYIVASWFYFMNADTGSGPGPTRGANAYGHLLLFLLWGFVASLVPFTLTLLYRKAVRPVFIVFGVAFFALMSMPALVVVASLLLI